MSFNDDKGFLIFFKFSIPEINGFDFREDIGASYKMRIYKFFSDFFSFSFRGGSNKTDFVQGITSIKIMEQIKFNTENLINILPIRTSN